MANRISIPRPNKKFKGPKRQYIVVSFEGVEQNCMLDQDTVDEWKDILEVTIARKEYTVRAATEEDVTAGNADKVGEVIDAEPWSRLEVVDYKLITRELDMKKFHIQEAQLEKQLMAPAAVEGSVLAEAI